MKCIICKSEGVVKKKVEEQINKGKHVVIALPERFRRGLPQRVQQYGIAWQRIGTAFPELEIWFVDIENNKLEKTKWSDCTQ